LITPQQSEIINALFGSQISRVIENFKQKLLSLEGQVKDCTEQYLATIIENKDSVEQQIKLNRQIQEFLGLFPDFGLEEVKQY